DAGERQSDRPLVPAVAVEEVKDRDTRQDGMSEIAEETDAGKPEQFRMRAQQHERAERIRLAPVERRALRTRQRFRQYQQAVEPVGETQAGGDPERQARR